MNMTNEEKTIHDMYEKINTPEYDPSNDVIRRIHSAPQKNIALRRVIIIAAVVCLIGTALGAAKMLVAKMISFDGEITQFEYQPNPITPTATPEIVPENIYIDEEHEFTRAAKTGELRMVINLTDNSALCNIPYIETTDINVILGYADNSYIPFSFPRYIPEGYSFTDGGVEFFTGEDSVNAELTYSETKDGKLYETYNLPESYKKDIRGIWLTYIDSEGHRLKYSIHTCGGFDEENPFTYNLTDGKTAQVYVPGGFDEGLLIHDSSENAYSLNSALLQKKIEPINAISHFPGLMHPETVPEKFKSDVFYYETYSSLIFGINAEILSEEEVIKIAESIN